jgi:hypothetical protein
MDAGILRVLHFSQSAVLANLYAQMHPDTEL